MNCPITQLMLCKFYWISRLVEKINCSILLETVRVVRDSLNCPILPENALNVKCEIVSDRLTKTVVVYLFQQVNKTCNNKIISFTKLGNQKGKCP